MIDSTRISPGCATINCRRDYWTFAREQKVTAHIAQASQIAASSNIVITESRLAVSIPEGLVHVTVVRRAQTRNPKLALQILPVTPAQPKLRALTKQNVVFSGHAEFSISQ
jgi:hypothetical protein